MSTQIITRFAPSPTGNLHIGGARAALFNFLYARNKGGKFLLRIDDTDLVRSNEAYTRNIIDSLEWLGLKWDNFGDEVYQSQRFDLYKNKVEQLLLSGSAYKCYASESEDLQIKAMPTINERKSALRSAKGSDHYTVRFKMPLDGEIPVHDTIAGPISIKYENLDDFVLLRQDSSPTYMLASVVDDGEMGITNIIRGADHLSNTYRQLPLLLALGYKVPVYTHIPLINNANGRKLSKRYDATSVQHYQEMGILSDAMCNYMLRLGWGHGDLEIISLEEAIRLFSLEALRPSPARFDLDKLLSLNVHYMKQLSNERILSMLDIPDNIIPQVRICLDNMREKADTLKYISEMSAKIFGSPVPHYYDDLPNLCPADRAFLEGIESNEIDFTSADSIKHTITNAIESRKLNRRHILMYIRIALTGMKVSPGLFEVMLALGRESCFERIVYSLALHKSY